MNYILLLSLEHMALIKTAIALWNKNDIHHISQLLTTITYDRTVCELTRREFPKIEYKVSEKIQQLSIPQSMKEKISCFIKPIGREIMELIDEHLDLYIDCNCGLSESSLSYRQKDETVEKMLETLVIPDELYWTPQGTINRTKIAEALVKDENLDIKTHYILACHYCLEKEIFELWNRMPENDKNYFCNKEYIKKPLWFKLLSRSLDILYKRRNGSNE